MDGTGDGGRWLSYAQLAELRGITKKAAVRMTQRHRWRRQPGNDGTALVWVPETDLTPRQPSRQTPRPAGDGDGGPDKDHVIEALRANLTEANRRASDAASLADRLTAQLADASEQADRTLVLLADAERVLTAERERADVLRTTINELKAGQELMHDMHARELDRARAQAHEARAQAQEAQEAAEELRQTEAARKTRGRLRRAWDGWRGR
jgi:hypothetical protein